MIQWYRTPGPDFDIVGEHEPGVDSGDEGTDDEWFNNFSDSFQA